MRYPGPTPSGQPFRSPVSQRPIRQTLLKSRPPILPPWQDFRVPNRGLGPASSVFVPVPFAQRRFATGLGLFSARDLGVNSNLNRCMKGMPLITLTNISHSRRFAVSGPPPQRYKVTPTGNPIREHRTGPGCGAPGGTAHVGSAKGYIRLSQHPHGRSGQILMSALYFDQVRRPAKDDAGCKGGRLPKSYMMLLGRRSS